MEEKNEIESKDEIKSLDDNESPKLRKIITKDNIEFMVDEKFFTLSSVLATLLECEKENEISEVNLNVSSGSFHFILLYLKQHFQNPHDDCNKKVISNDFSENIKCRWCCDNIKQDNKILYELINDVNYLGITCLLDILCVKIACMIKDKTPDEINKILEN